MKNGNTAMVYGFVALLSVLLWLGYLMFDKQKNRLFASLFGCVAAANGGYFLLSVCSSLAVAGWQTAYPISAPLFPCW